MRSPMVGALLCAALLPSCSDVPPSVRLSEIRLGAGTIRFEVAVERGYVPGSLGVRIDGQPVAIGDGDAATDVPRAVEIEVGWGPHFVTVVADFEVQGQRTRRRASDLVHVPVGAPQLADSFPLSGDDEFSSDEWLRIHFESAVSDSVVQGMELRCNGRVWRIGKSRLSPSMIVVDPLHRLPVQADCALAWRGADGPVRLFFRTSPRRGTALILYDRSDPSATAPFPDDYFTRADDESPTGLRVDMPIPLRPDVDELFASLLGEVQGLDGWSPIAHLVVELQAPLDPESVPRSPKESLDPLSSVVLVEIDSKRPGLGRRVPFRLEPRSETASNGLTSHTALIFPSIPLRPGRRYGLIFTRRARSAAGRPLGASRQMLGVLGLRPNRGDPEILRARRLLAPVLAVAAGSLVPPIRRSDIALATRFTVRSLDGLAEERIAIRQQIAAMPPPSFEVLRAEWSEDSSSPLAALIHGTWQAPEWREEQNWTRDEAGQPLRQGERPVPFSLALPVAAREGPVPIVMYQHGNPGSAAQELASSALDHLLHAGFAVAGFTDVLNREVSALHDYAPVRSITGQILTLLTYILLNDRVPDFWAQTNAEQLAFLRLLPELARVDWLPLEAPDGRLELDASAKISYVGVSEGANLAPALLPYAPEIGAAVLVTGGSRIGELLIHQESQTFLSKLPIFFPSIRPVDVWVAMALFQTALDRQDAHNHAHLLYREPIPLGGDGRRASVLLVGGLDDRYVPNHATASLAWQLGPLPQLEPVARPTPLLEAVFGPIRANIDARTTAAYVQYVPSGILGIAPTPGCVPPAMDPQNAGEGHFCAQLAEESLRQQANFLLSALRGEVPTIGGPAPQ